jgi:RNA polymerase sigma-70 factor, ECF subfamily
MYHSRRNPTPSKKGDFFMDEAAAKRGEITELLKACDGDNRREAMDKLMPLVYDDLHRIAHRYFKRERSNHTLQTTAIVHEGYLRLVGDPSSKQIDWQSRAHFFGVMARLFRQILVNYAKQKHRKKRGGLNENLPLEEALYVPADQSDLDLLILDEPLNKLAEENEHLTRIFELRYILGFSFEEIAEVMNIPPAKVEQDWASAKKWLRDEINRNQNG